jgi:hypothetical protein
MADTPPGIRNLQHTTLDELDLSAEELAAFMANLARCSAESRQDHGVPDPHQ